MLRAIYLSILCLLIFLGNYVCAQQSSVIHYQQANGFPGHNGYRILQDHAGYIWIGTENGLARFNGYEFKLFTTKDGLPDNEILHVVEDDSNRLWFIPFSNTVGYIKNGVVHNAENDRLLQRLRLESSPRDIYPDCYGNIMIAERSKITCINSCGSLQYFTVKNCKSPKSLFVFKSSKGEVQLLDTSETLFEFDGHQWHKVSRLPVLSHKIYYVLKALDLKSAIIFFDKIKALHAPEYFDPTELAKINGIIRVSADRLALLRTDGCFVIDIATTKIVDTILYGYSVSTGMVAADRSLWLCTLGKGAFRFIHSPVKSLEGQARNSSVLSIDGQQNGMYCALEKNRFLEFNFKNETVLEKETITAITPDFSSSPFTYFCRDRHNDWISFRDKIYKYKAIGQAPVFYMDNGGAIKDVLEENAGYFLVATAFYLLRFDMDSFRFVDTLLTKRVTSVTKIEDKIYTGTLNGLEVNDSAGQFHKILQQDPAINTHIVKLCSGTDHILWVGNSKGELIGIQGNKKIAMINDKTGLQCNRIAVIKVSSKFIWVGTDNGLYAIQNKIPYHIVQHLTYTSGLNSEEINCLDIYKGRVWVGTTEGVNYFEEQEIFSQSFQPKLIINKISDGDKSILQTGAVITLAQKALAIDFDVIDLVGGQEPNYQYRLNNDSTWISLEHSNLYFPEAPFGSFKVSIKAQSPNWKNELAYQLKFYRPYPFYLRWWFLALSFLLAASGVAVGVILYVRTLRKKDQEKVSIQRKLLRLEQMALQGQMNPHFIFNCISAIKQYYNSGDTIKANGFVDQFSALIRQTFEMVTQLFVPVDKELNYLTQYLSIEQTRFNDSFDFSITKDLNLPASAVYIPVMLLQPLAENAVRHGVRHLSGKRGLIHLSILQKDELVTITVTDNGIGREKSKSFGQFLQNMVPLTSTIVNTKRIELLNQLVGHKIEYHTEDIIDEQGSIAGTKITISYPLSIHQLPS